MTAMDRAGRSALDIRRSRHGRLAVASYWVARPSAVPGKWLHHHGAGYVYRFMHFLQPTRRSFLAYGMYCRRAHGTESAHPDTTIQQVLESVLYGSDVVHQGACLYRDRHQAKDGLVVESEVKRAHERYCAQEFRALDLGVQKGRSDFCRGDGLTDKHQRGDDSLRLPHRPHLLRQTPATQGQD